MNSANQTKLSSPAEQRMRSMRWEGKGTQVFESSQFRARLSDLSNLCVLPNHAYTTTWVPFPSRLGAARPGMTDEVLS